jgi:hypothetical protein
MADNDLNARKRRSKTCFVRSVKEIRETRTWEEVVENSESHDDAVEPVFALNEERVRSKTSIARNVKDYRARRTRDEFIESSESDDDNTGTDIPEDEDRVESIASIESVDISLVDANDGFPWDDYQDDLPLEENVSIRIPEAVNILAGLSTEFVQTFPNAMRASQTADKRVICYNKCDVDSISITSSSLFKVTFRLGRVDSKFVIGTKLNLYDVDKTSRAYIRCIRDSRRERLNFRPRNRSNTGYHDVIRLCRFKNIVLCDCQIGLRKFFII